MTTKRLSFIQHISLVPFAHLESIRVCHGAWHRTWEHQICADAECSSFGIEDLSSLYSAFRKHYPTHSTREHKSVF
jgi:hypothetical protein